MRLTLRTLLAWMDDTLPPSEVREIGKQVSESPLAKELVERIQRVTRQRRLTVPSSTGSDATDPNLVAGYLDNELDPDRVAELEKRCLTSDVHLAEVASVHQILSLIGQRAKVPAEAKHRMYHLIKGRESTPDRSRPAAPAAEPAPISEPVQPWVTPAPPNRPWIERFGPAAAVLALICVLCWSAWKSLEKPPAAQQRPSGLVMSGSPPAAPDSGKVAAKGTVANPAPGPEHEAAASGEPKMAAPLDLEADKNAGPGGDTELAKADSPKAAVPKIGHSGEVKSDDPAGAEAKSNVAVPRGGVGEIVKTDGVLLRYNPDRREWERVEGKTPLRSRDRLLSLAPFRSRLSLGNAEVDLISETEVWVLDAPATEAARINLAQGMVVLHGVTPSAPFIVQFAGQSLKITPPPGAVVGLERRYRREDGVLPTASTAILKVYSSDDGVKVAIDDAEQTLEGPGSITFDPLAAKWVEPTEKPTPEWVTQPNPLPFERNIGDQFLKHFQGDRPVIAELVEALEDDQIGVRRLAISSLLAVDGINWIIDLLYRPEHQATTRKAVIGVLRGYLAQGPDAAKALRAALQKDLGDEQARVIEKLLIGYSPKEARDEATYTQLVQGLSSDNIGIRQLALDNLMSLTGRDDLGYDPEKPESKGSRAWRELLRDHELRARPGFGSTK